jgi:tetratricopeptide (TPR) repeat protein
MTDLNDSTLFGNNDDLYSNKRQYDDYAPLAQVLPSPAEPLFPAATTVADSTWIVSAADDVDSLGDEQGYPSEYDSNLENDQVSGSSFEQSYRPLIEAATALSPMAASAMDASSMVSMASHDELAQVRPTPNRAPLQLGDAPSNVTSDGSRDSRMVETQRAAASEKDLLFNRQFAVVTDLMQHGAWPQALDKLQVMHAEYPGVTALENLLGEATLKTELMAEWTHKIKGRRLTVSQEWLIRRSLPFLLLLALFVSGTIFYRTFLAPSRQVLAMERANQNLVEEATALVQVGQIDEAIELYNVVLSRDHNNRSAQQGLVEANRQAGLAVTYDIAIRVANSGNLKRSLRLLQSVKAKAPAFRDIDARLARVNSLLDAEHAYTLAEKSFAQRRWMDAIQGYEQMQLLASDYQTVRVTSQLTAAYFMAAQKLMTQWPTPEFGTSKIRDFLRKEQEINGQDASVRAFLPQLDEFIKGERSLNNNNLVQAVETWGELYAAQPTFLGGYLAEELYRAYLALASEVSASDPAYARQLYTLAAAMPVQDSSAARTQLQNLGAAIPAP